MVAISSDRAITPHAHNRIAEMGPAFSAGVCCCAIMMGVSLRITRDAGANWRNATHRVNSFSTCAADDEHRPFESSAYYLN